MAVPEQLSDAVAANETTLLQSPASADSTIWAGQVIDGFSSSVIVTVNVHTVSLSLASIAVAVTVVVPTVNTEPLVGE